MENFKLSLAQPEDFDRAMEILRAGRDFQRQQGFLAGVIQAMLHLRHAVLAVNSAVIPLYAHRVRRIYALQTRQNHGDLHLVFFGTGDLILSRVPHSSPGALSRCVNDPSTGTTSINEILIFHRVGDASRFVHHNNLAENIVVVSPLDQ